jgi:hypothetical protein
VHVQERIKILVMELEETEVMNDCAGEGQQQFNRQADRSSKGRKTVEIEFVYTEDGGSIFLQKVSENGVSPFLQNIFAFGSNMVLQEDGGNRFLRNISGDGSSLAIRPQISDVNDKVFWATDRQLLTGWRGGVSFPTPPAWLPISCFPSRYLSQESNFFFFFATMYLIRASVIDRGFISTDVNFKRRRRINKRPLQT